LRESGLSFCIFRIGASPPVNPKGGDPSLLKFMFERTLKSRVEYVHPRDVGLAQVRALEVDEAWGKVLLIGGGTGCQITNRELINDLLTEVGIGALPDTAFAEKYLYGDWLDTTESQRLLDFQKHTYGDFLREVSSNIGFKRFGMGLVRPFVRRLLLSHSDAYKASRAR
jgi:nucleoside-diphosphate-sugar epimerase